MHKFNYFGVMLNKDGGMGEGMAHRVLEGRKVWGDDCKVVEGENDIQTSKTGVI